MPIPTWSGAIAITAYLLGNVMPWGCWSVTRPFRQNHKILWSVGGRTTRSGVITAPELHERQLSPRGELAGQKAFAIVCSCAFMHKPAGPLRGWAAPLGARRLLQEADLPLEVGEVLEALVNRGEAEVGDGVEGPQVVEDGLADHLAAHLGTLLPDLLLHRQGEGGDVVLADRAVLGRPAHPVDDLGPLERLPVARPLHDHEVGLLDPFERRVAPPAAQALPSPAGGGTAVGHARIDDLVVHAMAVRAAHRLTVPPRLRNPLHKRMFAPNGYS